MIYEIKKAFQALHHPGINTNIFRLIQNAFPYYLSAKLNVPCPVTIYFTINSVCNLHCKMCDVGQQNKNGTYYKTLRKEQNAAIDISVFKSVIDEVAKYSPNIAICATEPLLYPHLAEAVEYCAKVGLLVSVTTNGFLLTQKAEELVQAGLSELNVSIDSVEEIHDQLRGRKGSYRNAVNGVYEIKKIASRLGRDVRVNINAVILSDNYHRITDFVSEMKKLPVDAINFVHQWFVNESMSVEHNEKFGKIYPVTPSCSGNNPLNIDVDILDAQLREVTQNNLVHVLPQLSSDELFRFYNQPNRFLRDNSKCMISWFVVQVLADGNVTPYTRCYHMSLGNINNTSLLNIWNGEKMKSWRMFIKNNKKMPACKRCDLIY